MEWLPVRVFLFAVKDRYFMELSITTQPTILPFSVADAKKHIRLNTAGEDTQIEEWVRAAALLWERASGYTLTTTGYRLELDEYAPVVKLPRRPVQSVSSVQYRDTAGTWTTLSHAASGRRVFVGEDRPELWGGGGPVLRVDWTAGHTAAADIPALIKQAVKLMVAHMRETRTAYKDSQFGMREVPSGWQDIVNTVRGSL